MVFFLYSPATGDAKYIAWVYFGAAALCIILIFFEETWHNFTQKVNRRHASRNIYDMDIITLETEIRDLVKRKSEAASRGLDASSYDNEISAKRRAINHLKVERSKVS